MQAQKDFIRKLKDGDMLVGCGLMNINHSMIMNVYKNAGHDFVIIDCEHGTLSDVSVEELLRTCRLLGLPTVLRVPGIHQSLVAKPLDLGADGIMVPRVDTVEQLDEIVKAWRFPPRGKKGFGGFAQFYPGEKFEEVNDNRVLCIQIESREGADNLDAMLTKHKGEIQFVLIGPTDLSIDVGTPLNIKSEAELKVIDRVVATCKSHGVSIGTFCLDPNDMQYWTDRGINVLWISGELYLLQNEAQRVKKIFDALT